MPVTFGTGLPRSIPVVSAAPPRATNATTAAVMTATTSRRTTGRVRGARGRAATDRGGSTGDVWRSVTGRGSTADGQRPGHLRPIDRAFELVRAGGPQPGCRRHWSPGPAVPL